MIRVGIGGWNFAPWRGTFYPEDLPQKQELAYASRAVTAIEINATFYRTQSPSSFQRWAQETPDNFMFSVKAHRVTTHRKLLAEAKDAVQRFLASGVTELGSKLGPILWQLPPTKKFDPDDLDAFLGYLPAKQGSVRFRHVLEVRHESFADAKLPGLLRKHNVALCLADSEKYPMLGDVTADFVYLRLQKARAHLRTGYPKADLAIWAERIKAFHAGRAPGDLPTAAAPQGRKVEDAFVFFINGAKVRAPQAAQAFISEMGLDQAGGGTASRRNRRA